MECYGSCLELNGTDMHKWDWIVRSPTAVNIAIQGFAFNPANITVLKGTSVIWTNNDVDAHTVTSDTGVFDSGTLNQGNTFEFMFNDTGTFKYHCTLHPTMHGEVIVIAAPAPTIPPIEEIGIGLELVADNFTSPVALVSPEDGTGRRFIVDQIGVIKIINTSGQIIEEPFLDLRSKIVVLSPQYDERGLLGLAFHPNFSQNGRFFVYYSSPLRTKRLLTGITPVLYLNSRSYRTIRIGPMIVQKEFCFRLINPRPITMPARSPSDLMDTSIYRWEMEVERMISALAIHPLAMDRIFQRCSGKSFVSMLITGIPMVFLRTTHM